jgi:hypothetical protein
MLGPQKQRYRGQSPRTSGGRAIPHPDDSLGYLSVTRAFVVQFDTYTAPACGRFAGRGEHVVSGQATQFHSLEALLMFVAQVLPARPRTAGDGGP